MADEASKSPRPFDVGTIKYLVELMSRRDLSEIDLREGDQRIRLRRGPRRTTVTTTPAQPPGAASGTMAVPQAAPPKTEPLAEPRKLIEIKSPTPGTFYAASNPDSEPFVKEGAKVTPTSVVCIIEAMKIFTEITADCSGVIREILVENQQPVEYDQVLFRVDPAG